jgi:hypothetical protein
LSTWSPSTSHLPVVSWPLLSTPHLTLPHLTSPYLTSPHLSSPSLPLPPSGRSFHTFIEKPITTAARFHPSPTCKQFPHLYHTSRPILCSCRASLSPVNLVFKINPYFVLPISNLSHSIPLHLFQNYIATLHPLVPGDALDGELVVVPRTGDLVLLETIGDAKI